ncbi:MAG: hypothetical protein ABH869_01800 [Candidatus Omnitrophota bacterium]
MNAKEWKNKKEEAFLADFTEGGARTYVLEICIGDEIPSRTVFFEKQTTEPEDEEK